ncbi:MAG TPA: hypothetical protein VH436_07460 [Vicinamibacterales bacterium]|jgi:hypothetical protein
MVAHAEPVLLTFVDVLMIVVTVAGIFAVPALLLSRLFRIAAKAAIGGLGAIAVNAGAHTIASLGM